MMAMRQNETNLDETQEMIERRVLGGHLLVRGENENQERVSSFKKRCDQVLTSVKWVKEVTSALSSIKAIIASAFGMGLFVFSTTSQVNLLSELFPQISGGKQFSWSDPDGTIKAGFDSGCARPTWRNAFGFLGVPSGFRLQYGLVPNWRGGGWGVHWAGTTTQHFDASGFNALRVWVRGANGDEAFEIGLKDTKGKEVKIESKDRVAADALKGGVEMTIPLSEFQGLNLNSLNNISISFNESHGSGSLCFNNLSFEKPSLRI
ncbi:MAG: hypothetical protein JNM60_00630 [Candidatus Competibacteraceae bacterium]|nr:hypothetical protein [Candidatus Competibacteraceae bacterium]